MSNKHVFIKVNGQFLGREGLPSTHLIRADEVLLVIPRNAGYSVPAGHEIVTKHNSLNTDGLMSDSDFRLLEDAGMESYKGVLVQVGAVLSLEQRDGGKVNLRMPDQSVKTIHVLAENAKTIECILMGKFV